MKAFAADLQLHSCLSPCGSLACSPSRIAHTARARGLDIIALTDHNTAANCAALAAVLPRVPGLTAFFGAEVTTVEEIHVVCLFGAADDALAFGDFLRAHLPPRHNDPDYFGDQPIVDADEHIIRLEDALLAGATDLPLDRVDHEVHARGGLVIASHIDRPINSVFSQLGFWPADATLDACDLSPRARAAEWRSRVPARVPFVRSSDAHTLADIGRQFTTLHMLAPTFDEFRRALARDGGRAVMCEDRARPVSPVHGARRYDQSCFG